MSFIRHQRRLSHEKKHVEIPKKVLKQLQVKLNGIRRGNQALDDLLKDQEEKFNPGLSRIHGTGLFAKEDILENEIILQYIGERITPDKADAREAKLLKKGIDLFYFYAVDENVVIDATNKNCKVKFINHGCSPNCKAGIYKIDGEKRVFIYTLRPVARGMFKELSPIKIC